MNNEVLSVLVQRYMRKDGTFRFGDYVASILHLHIGFNMYETRDPLQNGYIKFSISDWLKSALMC